MERKLPFSVSAEPASVPASGLLSATLKDSTHPPQPVQRPRRSPGSELLPPAKAASYLIRRRGILFFRSRIPDEIRPVLGMTEFRRSLNTAKLSEARPVVMRLAVAVRDVYALARAYTDHTNGRTIEDNTVNLKDIQTLDRVHIQALADEWLHDALTNANAFTLRIGGSRTRRMDSEDLEDQAVTQERIAQVTREHIAAGQVEYLSNRAVQLMVQAGGMNITDAEALRETDSFRLLCRELAKASVKLYETLSKSSRGEFEAVDDALKALEEEATTSKPEETSQEEEGGRRFQLIPVSRPSRRQQGRMKIEQGEDEKTIKTKRKSSSSKFPTTEEAIDTYIRVKVSKGEWGLASQKDIPPTLRQFNAILCELENNGKSGGRSVLVDQLTRQHMRDYTLLLARLPYRTNAVKAYAGMSWHEIAKTVEPGDRTQAPKTIDTKQVNIRSFLNWCEKEYDGVVRAKALNDELTVPAIAQTFTSSPASQAGGGGGCGQVGNNDGGGEETLTVKVLKKRKGGGKASSQRTAFTDEDLLALFAGGGGGGRTGGGNVTSTYLSATHNDASKFWVPLIALFTGMRLEEICQLYISDVQTIDGVVCFNVNDDGDVKHVKTESGKRLVPVHPYLWKEMNLKGFYEQRKKIHRGKESTTMLFPDMDDRARKIRKALAHGTIGEIKKLSSPVASWFTRYRREHGVGGQEGETSSLVFHSFRHTFVTTLLHGNDITARAPVNMVQAIVGHSNDDELGITAVYAGSWPVTVLLNEAVMKLPWPEKFGERFLKTLAERSPWCKME